MPRQRLLQITPTSARGCSRTTWAARSGPMSGVRRRAATCHKGPACPSSRPMTVSVPELITVSSEMVIIPPVTGLLCATLLPLRAVRAFWGRLWPNAAHTCACRHGHPVSVAGVEWACHSARHQRPCAARPALQVPFQPDKATAFCLSRPWTTMQFRFTAEACSCAFQTDAVDKDGCACVWIWRCCASQDEQLPRSVQAP